MNKAQKILKLTENTLNVDNDMMQELSDYLGNSFYNKFKTIGGTKSGMLWYYEQYTISINIDSPFSQNGTFDGAFLILKNISRFFKTSKFKTKIENNEKLSIKYPKVDLPGLTKTTIRDLHEQNILHVWCNPKKVNNQTKITEITFIINPYINCIRFLLDYELSIQIEMFNFYIQAVLQACDILVKAMRLLDVENLN